MSDLEYRNRFCRSMVATTTDAVVLDWLLDPASETSLDKHSKYTVGASPSLATASRIRKVPSRWAEKVAGAVDMTTPDAHEVLAVIARDPRLGVRRALVERVKGLPLETLDGLVRTAMASKDSELFELAFTHQSPPAGHVVSWLCSEDAAKVSLSDTGRSAMAKLVLADLDSAVEVVTRCCRTDWVVAVLHGSVHGDVHFVDIVNAAGSELSPQRLQAAFDSLERRLPDMDTRMVEWLSANAEGRFSVNATRNQLSGLDDPALIAAWWSSGIPGASANLFAKHHVTSAAISTTVAALPGISDDVELAAWAAAAMCGAPNKSLSNNLDSVTRWAATVDAALSIMEGVGHIPRSEQSEMVIAAFEGIAGVLHPMAEFASRPELAPLYVRLAVLCPQVVGNLLLWQQDPVPGLVDLVAENPELFGVTGDSVIAAVDNRIEGRVKFTLKNWKPWRTAEKQWALLMWNTPGVVQCLARSWQERPSIDSVVAELLLRALGHSRDAWDTVLNLVPSWDGSVAELVGVAATFIEDVNLDGPTGVSAESVTELEVAETDEASDAPIELELDETEGSETSGVPAGADVAATDTPTAVGSEPALEVSSARVAASKPNDEAPACTAITSDEEVAASPEPMSGGQLSLLL